jgi:dolichol-phosphate mannosyltransferase
MCPSMKNSTLSVVVPARDEEDNLAGAVETLLSVVDGRVDDYEVFIVDDGSTDGTGTVAERLASEHPRVFALHNEHPRGLGGVIRQGLERARMTHFLWVDGKGATTAEALDAILARGDEADLVVPYPVNQKERPMLRRLISRAFVGILNVTFGLRLHYYTHVLLCRTEAAAGVRVHSDSTAGLAERLIKLIKAGHSYVEVGVEDVYGDEGRRTKAFKLRNITGVAAFYLRTVWEVYVQKVGKQM